LANANGRKRVTGHIHADQAKAVMATVLSGEKDQAVVPENVQKKENQEDLTNVQIETVTKVGRMMNAAGAQSAVTAIPEGKRGAAENDLREEEDRPGTGVNVRNVAAIARRGAASGIAMSVQHGAVPGKVMNVRKNAVSGTMMTVRFVV
jgi:hypothetical protein